MAFERENERKCGEVHAPTVWKRVKPNAAWVTSVTRSVRVALKKKDGG